MPPAADFAPVRPPRRPWRVRWIVVVAVSLLVHLTALDLLPRWTIDPRDETADGPIRATLLPPAVPEPAPRAAAGPTALPTPPPPQAAPPRRISPDFVPRSDEPVPQVAITSPTSTAPTTAAPTTTAAPSDPPGPSPDASPSNAGLATTTATTAATDVATPAASTPAPPAPPSAAPAATAPRSARLRYKVVYVDAKNAAPVRYYGVGSIDWALADDRYRCELVAAVDFLLFKVDVLASHSEGGVGPGGLSPDRYTESPRRRPTVATNFNRGARQTITFSASAVSAPLLPGAQDRLSVLFQIGALLLAADPAGAAIEIPVAGVRSDVETWRFEPIGHETIDAAGDPLPTTHLRRVPRPSSSDRTIDVWIAVENGGYPARVLYTEPNGSTIEMTLDGIGALDP